MGAVTTILNALRTVLPELSMSDGTIEKKIVDVVGTYADSEAIERANTLNVINQALASQKVTTVEYYRRKAVAFQNGDALSYDPVNQGGYYENIDPTKQIVKQAYITGSWPMFTLLVNKVGNDGHLTTLSESELASFKTYFSAFQPLGLNMNIASLPVAVISDPNLTIYVRKGSDASSIADAINSAFRENEVVLRKNNVVSLSEISDIIQRSSGAIEAVSFGNITASETQLDASTVVISPEKGLFRLTNGAFIFGTDVTAQMIKTLD